VYAQNTTDENGAAGLVLARNTSYYANVTASGYYPLWQQFDTTVNYSALFRLSPLTYTPAWEAGINTTFLPLGGLEVYGGVVTFGAIANYTNVGVGAIDYWNYQLWNGSTLLYNHSLAAPAVVNTSIAPLLEYIRDYVCSRVPPAARYNCLLMAESDPMFILATQNLSIMQNMTVPVDLTGYTGYLQAVVIYHRASGGFLADYRSYYANPSATPTPTPTLPGGAVGGGLALLDSVPQPIAGLVSIIVALLCAAFVGKNAMLAAIVFDGVLFLASGFALVPFGLPVVTGFIILAAMGLNIGGGNHG
jgi:hypothetical protein